jgi:hypothetical protein
MDFEYFKQKSAVIANVLNKTKKKETFRNHTIQKGTGKTMFLRYIISLILLLLRSNIHLLPKHSYILYYDQGFAYIYYPKILKKVHFRDLREEMRVF